MSGLYWILDDDGDPRPARDLDEWFAWTMELAETGSPVSRVAETIVGPYRVSTVFLAVNVGIGGPPLVFETMIFTEWRAYPEERPYQERYATRAEAQEGHQRAVAWVQERVPA